MIAIVTANGMTLLRRMSPYITQKHLGQSIADAHSGLFIDVRHFTQRVFSRALHYTSFVVMNILVAVVFHANRAPLDKESDKAVMAT
jgi:hypothetical protein